MRAVPLNTSITRGRKITLLNKHTLGRPQGTGFIYTTQSISLSNTHTHTTVKAEVVETSLIDPSTEARGHVTI